MAARSMKRLEASWYVASLWESNSLCVVWSVEIGDLSLHEYSCGATLQSGRRVAADETFMTGV